MAASPQVAPRATSRKWAPREGARPRGWIEGDAVEASRIDAGRLPGPLAVAPRLILQPSGPPEPDPGPADCLRFAAVAADEREPQSTDPAPFWEDLVSARATLYCDWHGASRSYVVALLNGGNSGIRRPLTESQAGVLLRVLCGEQQKAVAMDFAIAHSTASKRYSQALEKLDLHGRPTPLPVVVAAQRAARVVQGPWARRCTFEYQGCTFAVVSVPRPRVPAGSGLTGSERDVAIGLVEGRSRREIANGRSTSEQTVSCQLRTIFSKLRLTGRYSAVRKAAEYGWFVG